MNTFLPYPDFEMSAAALDNKRLGKQRVEAMQMIGIILKKKQNAASGVVSKIGFMNHPAVLMWEENVDALDRYYICCVKEWKRRGFKNTMRDFTLIVGFGELPYWLGMEEFHASHRSNLLRKDHAHYSQFGWREPDSLEYVWPVNKLSCLLRRR